MPRRAKTKAKAKKCPECGSKYFREDPTRGETVCAKCGNVCIERIGFSINLDNFIDNKCVKCGNSIPVVLDKYKKQKI